MRSTRAFRLGWPGFTWEIRFAFTPRLWTLGVGAGWDEPDPHGRPWIRPTGSVHLLCFAMTFQPYDADTPPDPEAVAAWLAANTDRM